MTKEEIKKEVSCVCCNSDEEHWAYMHTRSSCEHEISRLEEELQEELQKIRKEYNGN